VQLLIQNNTALTQQLAAQKQQHEAERQRTLDIQKIVETEILRRHEAEIARITEERVSHPSSRFTIHEYAFVCPLSITALLGGGFAVGGKCSFITS
jgi:hypothetical protein